MERDTTRQQLPHTTTVGARHPDVHPEAQQAGGQLPPPTGAPYDLPAPWAQPAANHPWQPPSAGRPWVAPPTAPSQQPRWANLAYHRLAHVTPSAGRWWRPLVMLVTFLGTAIALGIVVGVLAFAVHHFFPELPRPDAELDDSHNPADVLYAFGSIALFLPVVWVTVRAGGRQGTIHSVFGRFRWDLLARAARVVVPIFAVTVLGPFLLFDRDTIDAPPASTLAWILLFAALIVPLQAAAEEYVFRGLLPQMIGTWLRSPLWGVLVATPLFVLGHGYDWVGLIDIAAFALCAAYLVWKSGGLELSILMHASNNVMLSFMTPFVPGSMEQGAVEPASVVISVLFDVLLTAWMSRLVSKEYGLERFQPVIRPRETRAI